METEDYNVNFSSEDPENVSIPESLGPIAFEFFDSISFKIKTCEIPALKYQALLSLRSVQEFNIKFLVIERRFESKVLPSINLMFEKIEREYYNEIETKIIEVTATIIDKIPLEEYGISDELKKLVSKFVNLTQKGLENAEEPEKTDSLVKLLRVLAVRYGSDVENVN